MYKKSVLDNGLTVVSGKMPGRSSVSLGIWIKAGGRYESRQDKGISHFLEHMLFKGSRKYSCRQIKELIEGAGGSLNGFTSEEATCYLVKVPVSKLKTGMDILSDMVMRPTLPAAEFEKEKSVIMEELKMYKDLPQSYVHELLDDLLWPEHPLGMGIIGFEDSLASLKREDLRSYRDGRYIPSRIIVSAAGMLEHSELCALSQRLFSARSSVVKSAACGEFLPVSADESKSPVFKLLDKGTEQTHIAMGFRSFSREHPLKYASTLLHVIMGANMSSRLFHEVREKRGLAYEIGTQLKRYHDTGAFVVHAGIDNQKVHQALEVIIGQLRRIRTRPPEKEELRRAKEYFLGQLMLALEDTMDQMLFVGESATLADKIHTYEEISKGISAVSGNDIVRAAREILRQGKIRFAAIGAGVNDQPALLRLMNLE